MKKTYTKISAFLMVMVLFVCALSTTAFAASSTVTYKGRKTGFEFAPGSVYTETDLFDNFKNVMPGDNRKETVTIKNAYSGCDYIKVWMGAVLHDESGNPISPKVLEELQARKASSSDADMSDLDYMHDFLKQMTLTVWNGNTKIYQGSPDSLYDGFDEGNVYLGKIGYKGSIKLDVELAVDIEMGNEYADRIGEVDWVFVIEERNDSNDNPSTTPSSDDGGGSGSSSGTPEKEVITDQAEPEILPNVPKTGDDTVIWPYATLLGIGIVGMFLTTFKKRKKETE